MCAPAVKFKSREQWLHSNIRMYPHWRTWGDNRTCHIIAIALFTFVIVLGMLIDCINAKAANHAAQLQTSMLKLASELDDQALHAADFINTTIASSALLHVPRISSQALRTIGPLLSLPTARLDDSSSIPYTRPAESARSHPSAVSASSQVSPHYSHFSTYHDFLPFHNVLPNLSPHPEPEAAHSNHHSAGEQRQFSRALATTALEAPSRATPVIGSSDITFRRTVRPAVPDDTEQIKRLVYANLMANNDLLNDWETFARLLTSEMPTAMDEDGSSDSKRVRYFVVEEVEDSDSRPGMSPSGTLVGSLRVEMPAADMSTTTDAFDSSAASRPGLEARMGMLAVTLELGYKGVGPMLVEAAEQHLVNAAKENVASVRNSWRAPHVPNLRIMVPALNIRRDLQTLTDRGYNALQGERAPTIFYKDVDVEVKRQLDAEEVLAQTTAGAGAMTICAAALAGLSMIIGSCVAVLCFRSGGGAGAEPLLATHTFAVV